MIDPISDGHILEPLIKRQNLARQYDFMNTAFILWQEQGKPSISHRFLKDLNFYAAHNLSHSPGMYRDAVKENVKVGNHIPPDWSEVPQHMDNFVDDLKIRFERDTAIEIAAFAIWRLNWIHPFRQGNGRTARAISYFTFCQKIETWLPGQIIVPEIIRANRNEYCQLLQDADQKIDANGNTLLTPLIAFLNRMFKEQIRLHLSNTQG